jgi:hypothetical protein
VCNSGYCLNDFLKLGVVVLVIGAADRLIKELSSRFPASNLMDSLGVVYPQYWLQPNADELFEAHFKCLKDHYCYEKKVGEVYSPPMLEMAALNHEASLFKGAMKANAADAMRKPITVNPLTKLWRNLSMSQVLRSSFGEWFKVAEMAAVQVLGSVEDERTFSNVAFTKSKLRNRLSEHLAACVGIFSQKFYKMENFPFEKVYEIWHANHKRDC